MPSGNVEVVERTDRKEPAFIVSTMVKPTITMQMDVHFARALSAAICRSNCENKAVHAFALTLRDQADVLDREYYE